MILVSTLALIALLSLPSIDPAPEDRFVLTIIIGVAGFIGLCFGVGSFVLARLLTKGKSWVFYGIFTHFGLMFFMVLLTLGCLGFPFMAVMILLAILDCVRISRQLKQLEAENRPR